MNKWHQMSVSETALELGCDTKVGKTNIDPNKKRKPLNTVFRVPRASLSAVFKALSRDVSLLLLCVTYIIASFMGHFSEAIIGLIISIFVFLTGSYIKFRSDMRISNSYMLLLPFVKITEDGNKKRLSAFDLEVGDLIEFSAGDIIPADARLVRTESLKIAERRINEDTGKIEYIRYDKFCDSVITNETPLPSYENMVYAGSMVVSGSGSAIVTAIGNDTVLSKLGESVSVAPVTDEPSFMSSFKSETKRLSLLAIGAMAPVTMYAIYRQTTAPNADIDIMYSFMLILSLAVTCMSDFVTIPAESLVTKEILSSSRLKRAERDSHSRLTRLSATETLADTDTVLVMLPDVLVDKQIKVRQVFFSGNSFRFDTLRSNAIKDFTDSIYPFFFPGKKISLSEDECGIKTFVGSFAADELNHYFVAPSSFMHDSKTNSRVCVFGNNDKGVPNGFIAQSNSLDLFHNCTFFRTEGGSVWKTDRDFFSCALKWYQENVEFGNRVYVYCSSSDKESPLIFEGMLSVGEEFPFADNTMTELFTESAIAPILYINTESESSYQFVKNCGIADNDSEIAVASQYAQAGLTLSDAPISVKAYVGFGKSGCSDLYNRLKKNGKRVLPIIKDSANRRNIAPESVYAIHESASYDSVKIGASVSLRSADAQTHEGGLIDALNIIKRSSMARLKLGIYRNYLVFSLFFRALLVGLTIIFGSLSAVPSAAMILFSGFLNDFFAMLALMNAQGLPVRPKDTASDAKKLFSHSLLCLYVVSALISSISVVIITNTLLRTGALSHNTAQLFTLYSLLASVIFSIGAFLLILMKRVRRFSFNFVYLVEFLAFVSFLLLQSILPDTLFSQMSMIGFIRIDIKLIPYVLLGGAITFVCNILIDKFLSFISSFNK